MGVGAGKLRADCDPQWFVANRHAGAIPAGSDLTTSGDGVAQQSLLALRNRVRGRSVDHGVSAGKMKRRHSHEAVAP